MNFRIEELTSYRIAYLRRTGECGEKNVEVMEHLKKWANENNLFNNQSIILAIAHDDPQNVKAENCRYDACIVLQDSFIIKDNSIVNERNGHVLNL